MSILIIENLQENQDEIVETDPVILDIFGKAKTAIKHSQDACSKEVVYNAVALFMQVVNLSLRKRTDEFFCRDEIGPVIPIV